MIPVLYLATELFINLEFLIAVSEIYNYLISDVEADINGRLNEWQFIKSDFSICKLESIKFNNRADISPY